MSRYLINLFNSPRKRMFCSRVFTDICPTISELDWLKSAWMNGRMSRPYLWLNGKRATNHRRSIMAEISANVTDFLSKFPVGFARPNRYLVEMSLPPGIAEQGSWLNSESTAGTIEGHNISMNRTGASSNRLSYLHNAGEDLDDLSALAALCSI